MFGPLAVGLALGGTVVVAPQGIGQTAPADSGEVNLNAAPVVVNGRISRPTLRTGSQGEAVIELQSVLLLLGYYSGPLSGVFQENTQVAVRQFQADAGISPDGIVGPATWSSLFPTPPAEANPPGTASPLPNSRPATTTPSAPVTNNNSGQTTPAASSTTSAPEDAQANNSPPATATTPPTASRPTLRLGDRGDTVRQLQERLKNLGFYDGPVDGIFGTQTEAAVKQAQSDNDLTVDGVVGPATWSALD
jgi:peptidoglycan hydrolase-like protein with peptidoglycan-binding domain